MSVYEEALKLHELHHGKLSIQPKVPCENAEDLALAYTPGVAQPCLEINKDPENAYRYTGKGNTVAVVTDGTAVLGLGDIGAVAGLPVMEGKALLMKRFANLDAFPICIDSKDPEEIIRVCKLISPGLGAINLEDISAPRCVEIERRLIEELDIPVFHDDQHGTAIVVLAALINGLRLSGKDPKQMKVIVNGVGAAGSSIIKMMYNYGFKNILALDSKGVLHPQKKDSYNALKQELLEYTNLNGENPASLKEALRGADVFIGVSQGNLLTQEDVAAMNEGCFIVALANPTPEIDYYEAKKGGAFIAATGRSDFPNQVNNLLAFPGIFRGALDAKATRITEEVKIAAAKAIAGLISDEELTPDYVIPSPFDERVVPAVSAAVKEACIASGYIRK